MDRSAGVEILGYVINLVVSAGNILFHHCLTLPYRPNWNIQTVWPFSEYYALKGPNYENEQYSKEGLSLTIYIRKNWISIFMSTLNVLGKVARVASVLF